MIRKEITKQLDTLYPDIPIYGEEVPQGFNEPSFYVKVVSGSQNKEINTRYKRNNSFDIQYFAETNKECENMALELYENMEYLSNMAKGINMTHEIIDRVLHFFVDYNIYLMKKPIIYPKMNTLEVDEVAK